MDKSSSILSSFCSVSSRPAPDSSPEHPGCWEEARAGLRKHLREGDVNLEDGWLRKKEGRQMGKEREMKTGVRAVTR